MKKIITILLLLLGAATTGSRRVEAIPRGYAYCVYTIGVCGVYAPCILQNCSDGTTWSGWMPLDS